MVKVRIFPIICLLLFLGCQKEPEKSVYGDKARELVGQPELSKKGNFWLLDETGLISQATIDKVGEILESIQASGLAEVVIVVINGVTTPQDYATQLGRAIRLGKSGPSSQGGNNGIVWLIRPDAKNKITISVGRGLPRFTSQDFFRITDVAVEYCNFGNYNRCILEIAKQTQEILRKLR